jgi:toxin ParE1/3/4
MSRPMADAPFAVVLTPAAAADIDEAFLYVAEHNAAAARELLARLVEGVERLRAFPLSGAPLPAVDDDPLAPGIRFLVLEPYLVFYRAFDTRAVVLRVLHTRRDGLGELLG